MRPSPMLLVVYVNSGHSPPAVAWGWSCTTQVNSPCSGGFGVPGSLQPAIVPFCCCIGMQPEVFTHGATVAAAAYCMLADAALTLLLLATVTVMMMVVMAYGG